MRKRFLFKTALISLLFCIAPSQTRAQVYTVESISPELKKNASAVIRIWDETFEIISPSNAKEHTKAVVTILNQDGRFFSVYNGMTDKFSSTHLEKIVIYDANGKKVKSFGPSRVEAVPAFTINIYDDNYYYRLDPDYRTYPFTVEIETTEDYKGLFQMPSWYFHPCYNVSTEKSVLKVITPANYKLRYYENNNPGKVNITNDGGKLTHVWQAENVSAMLEEPLSVSLEKYTPSVDLAPSDFEIDGRKGNQASWESLGSFIASLNKGRTTIEGETENMVKSILATTPDTVEIIRKLYKYLQDKTHYVSIAIGIGGWQPLTAQTVDAKSYGDCKALSNYMKSLLQLAGIKSNYTLVMSGSSEDDIYDFPSAKFNHAILSVPRGADTIWLECTNQYSPFNYLGSFTDDRHVLLITDNGGKLVKTPKYSADQNHLYRKANVTIDPSGNGTADVSTEFSYVFFDQMRGLLYTDQEGRKKAITNSIDIPGFTLVNFSVRQPDKDQPVFNESISLKLTKYATLMGDRMLLPVNLMDRVERLPSNVADRKMDIEFKRDRMLVDEVIYKIPSNYSVPSVPSPIEITSPFGHYKAEITVNGNEVTYKREIRYNKGIYPVSQYQQLLDFYKSVSSADNTKLALKRQM
jgi:hypothetical protein